MKKFNVKVPEEKIGFVSELLDSLGFEWGLEGHVDASEQVIVEPPKTYEVDEEARKKAAKVREESLKDVINRIEAMRKK
ncbi:hypothetical protein [Carboxylicivirga marina]|uniref:hypothetical protein n=1 Tax=Carboxylicivirga marina TaxID=2800988 RepID=UPI002596C290|nr:hypothetical protein [uncultured Carboxylicivirga sp.]